MDSFIETVYIHEAECSICGKNEELLVIDTDCGDAWFDMRIKLCRECINKVLDEGVEYDKWSK